MSFDKATLVKLAQELEENQKREAEIVGKMQKLFGAQFPTSGMVTAGKTRKVTRAARKAAKAKGPKAAHKGGESLQDVVLHAMGTIRKAKTALEIAQKIQTKRPQTTHASVASVLYQLAKRGKVLRADGNMFYLPASDAQPGFVPGSGEGSAPGSRAATEALMGPSQTASSTSGPIAGPSQEEVLEDA